MRILSDGTVEIRNKKTGETKIVSPNELPSYGIGYDTYATQLKAAKEVGIETTADIEPKGSEKIESAKTAIDLLESIYLGGEGEQSLAFGQTGFGGRLPGAGKDLQRQFAPDTFPESERLNTYKRTLESIRPQLAKAAGDAGNIALREQIMAGKGLPDEQSTPGEAIALLKAMRGKFGLEDSERLSTFEKERLPESSGSPGSKQIPRENATENLVIGNRPPTPTQPTNILSNILKGGAREQMQQKYTGNPLSSILAPRNTAIAQQTAAGQQVSGDERIGAGGETIANILPFLAGGPVGAAGRMAIGGGVRGLTTPGATSQERLASGGKSALLEGLLGAGASTIGKGIGVFTGKNLTKAAAARETLVKGTTQKFSTNKLVNVAEDYVKNDPAAKRLWENTLKSSLSKGGLTADELTKRIGIWGRNAFTLSGKQGKPASAGLYGTLSRAGRSLLKEAPELAKAHQRFAKATGRKNAVSGTLKKLIFPSAIGAGVGIPLSIALSKLLGQSRD